MSTELSKKLRVLVLVHEDLVPPESIAGLTPKEIAPWRTEWDVISTVKKMGHDVYPIGVYNNLGVIGNALIEHKPHVAFNLLEEFHGYPLYDQHVVSYLELMKQPYTGCNPRGLTISHDKALSKMVLAYHRIHIPAFAVFHMNRKVKRSKRLQFPLLVKSISEEGSVGIARASIVPRALRTVSQPPCSIRFSAASSGESSTNISGCNSFSQLLKRLIGPER